MAEEIVFNCNLVRVLLRREFKKRNSARVEVENRCGTMGPTICLLQHSESMVPEAQKRRLLLEDQSWSGRPVAVNKERLLELLQWTSICFFQNLVMNVKNVIKVKRRCDGSRYVVKRPARSQILKKRAAQLVRERTGISTDDDAMSELKLGHFHTREERKKHLEEERRRKIRNQQKLIESKISPADQVDT
ncbi:unnamed protein product [Heligmosomoides polygyrus]|uniref:40S ribosomal protein S19-binding protein 1 n=1 Tax=Heligmosomoides polygyrus TaxID=6339 RepID=A0A183F8I2_HELPZ|nr:unnamed protein product [Heligmosomoides polygyrus]